MAQTCTQCKRTVYEFEVVCSNCGLPRDATPATSFLAGQREALATRWQQGLGVHGLRVNTAPAVDSRASGRQMQQASTWSLRPPLGADGVELVRFAGEPHFAELLASLVDLAERAKGAFVPDAEAIRRQLQASHLLLQDSMAPDVYQLARDVAAELGITEPVEIYQGAGAENAAMHMVQSPMLIEIRGQLLGRSDDGMLRALLGHEMGHYLAHGWQSPFIDAARAATAIIAMARQIGVDSDDEEASSLVSVAARLSMSQELTADRFGLLAAGSLEAALRLTMMLVSGVSDDVIVLDTQAYLGQARRLMEQALVHDEQALGSSHPEHSFRAYAQWLFSESDLFCALTGAGTGHLPLAEVDARLMALLGHCQFEPGGGS